MRGFDYRSSQGIDLYLCKAFPSNNDLQQAWQRVGRHGDKCARFALKSIELIDLKQKAD